MVPLLVYFENQSGGTEYGPCNAILTVYRLRCTVGELKARLL